MAFVTNSAIQTRTAQQAPACERHSVPTCSGASHTRRNGMAKTNGLYLYDCAEARCAEFIRMMVAYEEIIASLDAPARASGLR